MKLMPFPLHETAIGRLVEENEQLLKVTINMTTQDRLVFLEWSKDEGNKENCGKEERRERKSRIRIIILVSHM